MKAKVLVSAWAIVVVLILAVFFFRNRSVTNSSAGPQGNLNSGQGATANGNRSDANEPNLPTAIVLYDRVTFEPEDKSDLVILNSGDAVGLVEDAEENNVKEINVKEKATKYKVTLKNGKTGFVASAQLIAIPDMKSASAFYNSTEPLSTFFYNSDELDAEARKKYDEFTKPDFLNRAKNNPDSMVATWAQELDMADQPEVTEEPNIETSPDN